MAKATKLVRGVDFPESLDRSRAIYWVLNNVNKTQKHGGSVHFAVLAGKKRICLSFDVKNENYGKPDNKANPTLIGECCHLALTSTGWTFSKGQEPFRGLKEFMPATKMFSDAEALTFVQKFFEIAEAEGLKYAEIKKLWVEAGKEHY